MQPFPLRRALRGGDLGFRPGRISERPWETRLLERQAKVRALYIAQAKLLYHSPDASDRRLGAQVEAFVRGMPAPHTRRLALARKLREAARQRDPGSLERSR